MQYPPLSSAKAINFASQTPYSPYYDIVWSFDYAISGNSNTEAGFVIFLTRGDIPLNGGSGGIDLGYSGLSSFNIQQSYITMGIAGAAIGIGFDTTGLFAASAYNGSYVIRDGISSSAVLKNSVTVRGLAPHYPFSQYSYHYPISALNSTFTIVESGEIYKTIRARLGNVGRTLYIDYRNNPNEEFQLILEKDVSVNIDTNVKYRPGVSFVSPISSFSSNAIGNIFVKNIHTEGKI